MSQSYGHDFRGEGVYERRCARCSVLEVHALAGLHCPVQDQPAGGSASGSAAEQERIWRAVREACGEGGAG